MGFSVNLVTSVAVVVLSGCLKPPEVGPIPLAPIPAVGSDGPTLAGCIGTEGAILVPTALTAQHLPSGFEPLETAPGVSLLSIDAFRCERASVDGADAGPANLVVVDLGARPTREPLPEGYYARIIFSAVTNSEALAKSMMHTGFRHTSLEVDLTLGQLSTRWDTMTVSITYESNAYAWTSLIPRAQSPKSDDFRAFNAHRPDAYADHLRRFQSTGAAATQIQVSSESPAARLMPHWVAGQGVTTFLADGSIRFIGPHEAP